MSEMRRLRLWAQTSNLGPEPRAVGPSHRVDEGTRFVAEETARRVAELSTVSTDRIDKSTQGPVDPAARATLWDARGLRLLDLSVLAEGRDASMLRLLQGLAQHLQLRKQVVSCRGEDLQAVHEARCRIRKLDGAVLQVLPRLFLLGRSFFPVGGVPVRFHCARVIPELADELTQAVVEGQGVSG